MADLKPYSLSKTLQADVDNFLSAYSKNERLYQILAQYAETRCRDILDEKRIKGLVTSRTKEYESLATKVVNRAQQWTGRKKYDVSSEIDDLVGVRMALYFPNDVPLAAEEVLNRFDIVIPPIVKTAKRENETRPEPQRQTDKQQHVGQRTGRRSGTDKSSRELLPAEYRYGPWRSVSQSDMVHRWKHSGYRAVHLILDLNEAIQHTVTTSSKGEGNRQDGKFSARDLQFVLDHKITNVEVQITTVVMQAWSEVEHDIIYKNKYGLPYNSTINRMLDGINGLSITSEILLDELQKTFNSLLKENEMNFATTNAGVLRSWLERNYVSIEDRWNTKIGFVEPLWAILTSPLFGIDTGIQLRKLISQSGIVHLPPRGDGKFPTDLSAQIVIAISRTPIVRMAIEDPILGSEAEDSVISQLYDILLAANAFTIMFAIDGRAARAELSVFSRAELMNFNRMFLLLAKPHHAEVQSDWVEELATFARNFLEDQDSDLHDISTAFSRLSLFTGVAEEHPLRTKLTQLRPVSFEDLDSQDTIDQIVRRLLSGSTLVLSEFHFLQVADGKKDEKHAEKLIRRFIQVGAATELVNKKQIEQRFFEQIVAVDPYGTVGDMAWFYVHVKELPDEVSDRARKCLDTISIRYQLEIDLDDVHGEPEKPRGLSDRLSEVSPKTIETYILWLEQRLRTRN
ncbi:hypothetical protein GGR52DRAFT_185173 [Hypoxylon sp. FL1284]|nr:hypothetical protein GGR52DRAFT_185173 [Hypoxylon sp. FL1284]